MAEEISVGLVPGQLASFERMILAQAPQLAEHWKPIRAVLGKLRKQLERALLDAEEARSMAQAAEGAAVSTEAVLRGHDAILKLIDDLTYEDMKTFKRAAMARGDSSFIRYASEMAKEARAIHEAGATLIIVEPHPLEMEMLNDGAAASGAAALPPGSASAS